jgi:hemolysin III
MITDEKLFTVKDPISALTHLIGAVAAIVAMPVLLLKGAAEHNSMGVLISYAVFMFSMILLYSASASYHSFSVNYRVNKILKKMDHMSIFLLIAGSYTPVAAVCLPHHEAAVLLILIWSIAIAGIIFKAFWVTCPKWVSSVIYTAMGWVCIFFIKDIYAGMSLQAFLWLFAGGLMYTIGAVIYALKPALFEYRIKGFGNHELFHCFVLAGSLCHFIMVYHYLTVIASL